MRAKSVVVAAVVSLVAALGVVACTKKESGEKTAAAAASHEAALGRVMAALDECNALLASLKGPEDVPGAKARIEGALGKVSGAEKELSALPELSDAQKKALGAKYGPQLEKRTSRLGAEAARLRPATTKSAGPIMKEAGGPDIRETAGGSGVVKKVNDTLNALRAKLKKRLGTRRGSGTASVRG